MQRSLLAALAVVTFCGCTVGPDYEPPQTQAPGSWSGVDGQASTTRPAILSTQPADAESWWKSLHDPTLDSLMDRAVGSNLDLRLAGARVREARAQRSLVAADWWPQLDFGSGYNYRGSSANTGAEQPGGTGLGGQLRSAVLSAAQRGLTSGQGLGGGQVAESAIRQVAGNLLSQRLEGGTASPSRASNLFQAGFDALWELDVFGGTRRAVEAADADLAAAEDDRNAVLVTLLSEVALNYVEMRGAQRRLVVARDNIRAQQDTVELTQMRHQAGFTSQLDVSQARAQLATTQSQVPALESQIKQGIYQLSTLLGQPPAALLSELEKQGPIPVNPPKVPVGLPSDLLRRRPDIRVAERQLAAATARIGVATADLFPRFSLTGSFGPQTRDIRYFFDRSSLGWSIGPQISWPVLDGWRIRSNIEIQDARQEQAATVYEVSVLVAFAEVETALVAYVNEQERYRSLADAVAANQISFDLSNELYTRGRSNFLNVLDSQRALYASQDQLIQSQTAVITNLIALYKALGGGWPAD